MLAFYEDLISKPLLVDTYFILIFGGIYLNINTLPVFKKILNNEKLNIQDIICLVCSVLANIGVLTFTII